MRCIYEQFLEENCSIMELNDSYGTSLMIFLFLCSNLKFDKILKSLNANVKHNIYTLTTMMRVI